MAFPVGHAAVGLAVGRILGKPVATEWRWAVPTALLSIVPDLDFILVWLGYDRSQCHRTWTHSVFVALALAWVLTAAHGRLARRSFSLSLLLFCFAVVASHDAVDAIMVEDQLDHGVKLLWPLSEIRFGWRSPLVPFYQYFYPSAKDIGRAAVPYTLLELVLGLPVWIWVLTKSRQRR